jgi:hypothetical protein
MPRTILFIIDLGSLPSSRLLGELASDVESFPGDCGGGGAGGGGGWAKVKIDKSNLNFRGSFRMPQSLELISPIGLGSSCQGWRGPSRGSGADAPPAPPTPRSPLVSAMPLFAGRCSNLSGVPCICSGCSEEEAGWLCAGAAVLPCRPAFFASRVVFAFQKEGVNAGHAVRKERRRTTAEHRTEYSEYLRPGDSESESDPGDWDYLPSKSNICSSYTRYCRDWASAANRLSDGPCLLSTQATATQPPTVSSLNCSLEAGPTRYHGRPGPLPSLEPAR